MKAFHLKFEEVALEKNIMKWDVAVLTVSKNKRHLDSVSALKFWEHLDKLVPFSYIICVTYCCNNLGISFFLSYEIFGFSIIYGLYIMVTECVKESSLTLHM